MPDARKRRNIGSKSERVAVTLQTEDGEFVLRVLGGNALSLVLDGCATKNLQPASVGV